MQRVNWNLTYPVLHLAFLTAERSDTMKEHVYTLLKIPPASIQCQIIQGLIYIMSEIWPSQQKSYIISLIYIFICNPKSYASWEFRLLKVWSCWICNTQMKTVPGLSSWELGNRLITTSSKQNLIVKTSNTSHQPSSRGHWCTLLGELSIVHLVLTKPIAKANLRRGLRRKKRDKGWEDPRQNWRESRERKTEVDCLKWGMHDRCHQSWLRSETELEFGLFLKREEMQRTHKKTLKQGKNQNTDLTHFITTDPGLLSRPH